MNSFFTSYSTNFIDPRQTGVDPRTGQFIVNIPLVRLVGNNLMGPNIYLDLSYSPFSESDFGFGTGFSFCITNFNALTNILELSSGENYKVQPSTDIVRGRNTSDFKFSYTNGINDSSGYTVIWEDGKKEQLALVGGDLFVTTLITSSSGHMMNLSWGWTGLFPQLLRIDDEVSTLCLFVYDACPEMIIFPCSDDECRIYFEVIFNNQLERVSRVASDANTLTWCFRYENVLGIQTRLLTGITYPTGMTDFVEYSQAAGLLFPDSSGIIESLPVVISHIRNPGIGQSEIMACYEYTEQNFLGYKGDFGNWLSESDYIYTTLTDYVYGSTATVSDGSCTIKTTRKYNNYHLKIYEDISNVENRHITELLYYAEPYVSIELQPPQFQFLREKKDIWITKDGSVINKVALSEFDSSGNLIREMTPDGIETVIAWYDAAGEDGCPAEPHGFVRFMKSQIITYGDTKYPISVFASYYTYAILGNRPYVVLRQKINYADDVLLQKLDYIYHADDNVDYGRIKSITNTRYEKSESTSSITARQTVTTSFNNGKRHKLTTFSGYDDLYNLSIR